MDTPNRRTWLDAIREWRSLTEEERQFHRLASIPGRVVNSMAIEREPVDEAMVRKHVRRLLEQPATSRQ